MKNVDATVSEGFGREWSTFTQGEFDLNAKERAQLFDEYFRIFPWQDLPKDAVGLDAGCGSGRWAAVTAQRVGGLHALDASANALATAKANLAGRANVFFHHSSVSEIPLPDESLDFAYSLGVLHHLPDTSDAIRHIASKLKHGAPFLVYLYYAFDNRPTWFRAVWRISEVARWTISRSPASLKYAASQLIAATVYWPIARVCTLLARLGFRTSSIPLEAYKDRSFYTMRTDAYDRFCTTLEKRFTRSQIDKMLRDAGFERIVFSDQVPFWCAVGWKR
ncbi:class I SAM-dependent methyltransferase [Bradyrhizobium symbiodeficiens]|uniref:class I SAM-dependent methyltransferase n=1 Tax=Bradyrhizobium symbiodeficiens TaxID=1404367 RepID=UPI00140FF1EF|nr:class I SAM-dependent methyltransferase [Bradyrhizobium symbiodeficiens]QIP01754.1 class I SAM-dependent methyltransferase [Bradyrhizobium symbiodeficiens]